MSWNGDSYDVPLWILQTEEMQGKGSWGEMFLSPDTGLVAHTDLYRVTPNIGLCPKSIVDIQKYFNKPERKSKKKSKQRVQPTQTVFSSIIDAVCAFATNFYPECINRTDVTASLGENAQDVGKSVSDLMALGQERKKELQQQRRKRKRDGSGEGASANTTKKKRTKNPRRYETDMHAMLAN